VKVRGVAGVETLMSLIPSKTVVTYGTGVNLVGKLLTRTGTVVKPLVGKTIVLRFTPAKGSAYERTAKTNSTGTWSYKDIKISYNWVVTARYLGDATYRPIARGAAIKVATRVLRTFPANGSSSSATTTLKISGSVAPSADNAKIYLQRYVNGRWSTLSSTTVNTSTYVFSLKPGRGKYILRVYMPATLDLFKKQVNYQGYSAGFTLYRT
jgi:hypothetical protein